MKKLNLLGILALAGVFMLAGSVRAEEAAMDMNKGACQADAAKLCTGVTARSSKSTNTSCSIPTPSEESNTPPHRTSPN